MTRVFLILCTLLVALLLVTIIRWTREYDISVKLATAKMVMFYSSDIASQLDIKVLGSFFPYVLCKTCDEAIRPSGFSLAHSPINFSVAERRTTLFQEPPSSTRILPIRYHGSPQINDESLIIRPTTIYNIKMLSKNDGSVVQGVRHRRDSTHLRFLRGGVVVGSSREEILGNSAAAAVAALHQQQQQQPDKTMKRKGSKTPMQQSFMHDVTNLFHHVKEKNERQRNYYHDSNYGGYNDDENELVDILVAFLLFLFSICISACFVYVFSLGCAFCMNLFFHDALLEDARPALVSDEQLEQFSCPTELVNVLQSSVEKQVETHVRENKDNDWTCAVCFEPVVDREASTSCRRLVLQLPCEHLFHKDCVAPWLQREQVTCPLCKLNLAPFLVSSEQEQNEQQNGDQPSLEAIFRDLRLFRPTSSWWSQLLGNFPTGSEYSNQDRQSAQQDDDNDDDDSSVELELAGLIPTRR